MLLRRPRRARSDDDRQWQPKPTRRPGSPRSEAHTSNKSERSDAKVPPAHAEHRYGATMRHRPPSRLASPSSLAIAFAGLLALPWLAAGCSAAPGPRVAEEAVRVAGLDPVALREMGLAPRWIAPVRSLRPDGITQAGVFGDAVALVEGPDNLVTALNWADGRQRWKKSVGLASEDLFAPAFRDGTLLVNSASRLFEFDAANGDLTGVDALDRPVSAGGVVYEPYLVFGGINGRLFAHNLDTGRTGWEYQMSGNIAAPPVLAGDTVFVADVVGTYGLFDAREGGLIWRNHTFGPVTASPVVHRNNVLVPSEDRTLYALERSTGNDAWLYRATQPLREAPLSVGRDVYLPVPGGGLIGLDPDGQPRWEIPLDAVPVLAGERGIYATLPDGLVLLDPEDGGVVSATRTGPIRRAATGPDGSLLLVFADGRVVRLDPTN